MAEWAAKSSKKDCNLCAKLRNPNNFPKGTKVRIAEAFDCGNCPVTKGQSIPDNENIIELYNALPNNYDSVTGRRIVTVTDIKILFDFYEVSKELRLDYYSRIMYLHQQIVEGDNKERKKLEKTKEKDDQWKQDKLQQLRLQRS